MIDTIGDWRRTKYASDIAPDTYGGEETVAGWVHDVRNLGGIAFLLLRDRTGMVQLTFIKKEGKELFERMTALPRESVVMARGIVQENKQAKMGFEMVPREVRLLGLAKAPLPLGVADKVGADLDTRLDNRYMDLRKPEVMAIFKIRSTVTHAVHSVFRESGFVEIQTPKIVATATEGGTALFPMKYFERDAYLNQSPQLYKQIMMASGLDRVYEIGPAFRAEEHNTVRHLNEFTSIDMEMSFADEEGAMQVLERVVDRAIRDVEEKNQGELQALGIELHDQPLPYPRVTYDEAIDAARAGGVEVEWGEDFSMEASKAMAKRYPGFYFITHWPTEIKPFYAQPFEDEPRYCRAFDLNFAEKEITSGAQRVHDPELLRSNIERMGLDPGSFEFYTRAFEFGMPPHSGWGLGLDRVVMMITQRDNIRECTLFPRDRTRLVP